MGSEQDNPLQKNVLKYISSGKVYATLEKLSEKFDLNLNQLDELNLATEQVLIGKLLPELFVKTISTNLEIPTEKAKQITTDINAEIIMKVREHLQNSDREETPVEKPAERPVTKPITPPPPQPAPQIQTPYTQFKQERQQEKPIEKPTERPVEKPQVTVPNYSKPTPPPAPAIKNPTISAIEKAGDFTIEKNSQKFVSMYNSVDVNTPKIEVDAIEKEIPMPDFSHLLTEHSEQMEEKPAEQIKPTQKPAERKPYTVDPYREAI